MPAKGRGQLLQRAVLGDGQGKVAQRGAPKEAANREPPHELRPIRLLGHDCKGEEWGEKGEVNAQCQASVVPRLSCLLTGARDRHKDDGDQKDGALLDGGAIEDRRQHNTSCDVRDGRDGQTVGHVRLAVAEVGKEKGRDHLEVHLGHIENGQAEQEVEEHLVLEHGNVQEIGKASPEIRFLLLGLLVGQFGLLFLRLGGFHLDEAVPMSAQNAARGGAHTAQLAIVLLELIVTRIQMHLQY